VFETFDASGLVGSSGEMYALMSPMYGYRVPCSSAAGYSNCPPVARFAPSAFTQQCALPPPTFPPFT